VCMCVCVSECDREDSIMRWSWPTRGCWTMGEKMLLYRNWETLTGTVKHPELFTKVRDLELWPDISLPGSDREYT
jgi:hypothetical protein